MIYVIDKGRVIDKGKHDELLRTSPDYKNFYEKQLKRS
jgi:subfamily B ATP-binding cassette protein MsbA